MGLTFTTKLFFSFKKALQVVQNGTRLPAKPPLPAKPASRQNPPPAKPTSGKTHLLQKPPITAKSFQQNPPSKTYFWQNPPPAEPTSRKTQTSGRTHLPQNPNLRQNPPPAKPTSRLRRNPRSRTNQEPHSGPEPLTFRVFTRLSFPFVHFSKQVCKKKLRWEHYTDNVNGVTSGVTVTNKL